MKQLPQHLQQSCSPDSCPLCGSFSEGLQHVWVSCVHPAIQAVRDAHLSAWNLLKAQPPAFQAYGWVQVTVIPLSLREQHEARLTAVLPESSVNAAANGCHEMRLLTSGSDRSPKDQRFHCVRCTLSRNNAWFRRAWREKCPGLRPTPSRFRFRPLPSLGLGFLGSYSPVVQFLILRYASVPWQFFLVSFKGFALMVGLWSLTRHAPRKSSSSSSSRMAMLGGHAVAGYQYRPCHKLNTTAAGFSKGVCFGCA